MNIRGLIVKTATAVSETALTTKKLISDPELNNQVKEDGKKAIDSIKTFGKSVEAVTKNAVDNVSYEFNSIKEEVKSNLKEKETEINDKVSSRKEAIKTRDEEMKAKLEKEKTEINESEQEKEEKETGGK